MSRRPATSLSAGAYLSRFQENDRVREELRQELLSLPVPAFDRMAARLLEACGYAQVQVLAESQGGADLVASTPNGLAPVLTLAQAKQYREPVSRRFVDELRGAMLRRGASHGLLLTTSSFYGPAWAAAEAPCPLPVRLVDGEELLDLLTSHGLGVRQEPGGLFALDRRFLAALASGEGPPAYPRAR